MRPITTDSFPHLANCALDIIRGWFSTRLSTAYAKYWGVRLGQRCRFYGLPIFRRLPASRINIGDRCGFRSAVWSNYAGLNHPCMIVTLAENASIRIGNDCGFSGASIAAAVSVNIGNRVMLGANSTINDTDWHHTEAKKRANDAPPAASPVVIEDDVWLGANVTVLKGVTIGARSVIAANSVVTKSIPADVIAGGIPARPLKSVAENALTTPLGALASD